MEYKVIENRIHVYPDHSNTTYIFRPDELIKTVETEDTGETNLAVADLADILAKVLKKHPEVFT